MFERKSTPQTVSIEPPTGSPPPAYDLTKARTAWFERSGSLVVDRNRYFVLLILALTAIVCLALFAFKAYGDNRPVPYILKEGTDGSLKSVGRVAENFTPEEAHKRYFAAAWLRYVRERETARLSESNLKTAWAMTRAAAQDQFRTLMNKESPIYELQKDPTLAVRLDNIVVSSPGENIYLIRYRENRSSANEAAKTTPMQLVLRYVVEPPRTEQEREVNPIGFYVINFEFKEERA